MTTTRRWVIFTVILAGISATFFWYQTRLKQQNEQPQGGYEPSITVESVNAGQQFYQPETTVTGVLVPDQQIKLINELPGKITRIEFGSGSIVRKGEILLEIDHAEEQGQLIAARARLNLGRTTLARFETLLKGGRISQQEVDKAIKDLKTAESDVAVLQSKIDKKVLRAPFDAQVSINNLEPGQYLEANSDIATLVGTRDLFRVDFELPQTAFPISLDSEVRVYPVGSPETLYKAKITAINPMLSATSRSLKYRAELHLARDEIKANALVKVIAQAGIGQNAIIIPEVSLLHDRQSDYVYLLNPEGEASYRASKLPVTLQDRVGESVVISSGLEAGQQIAAKGAFKLYEGAKVMLADPSAAGEASDGAW
ncbi:efflux RND transporter periplasmic adaptor subunit [Endozoicomonadaceae bacterium StTr2]